MTTLPEMPCREFVERVSDYLEGALDDADRRRLETHLAECELCAHYLEQQRHTVALTGRLAADDLTDAMRHDLHVAFSLWRAEG